MKSFLTLFLLLIALSCRAQVLEVGYGPYSNIGVGGLPSTSKVNVSFLYEAYRTRSFRYLPGLRYAHVHSRDNHIRDKRGARVDGIFNMLFILPASFNVPLGKAAFVNRMGFGLSTTSFPNNNGRFQNFVLEVGFRYAISPSFSISLRYSHISNGWRGQINPGVDNVVLSTGVYF